MAEEGRAGDFIPPPAPAPAPPPPAVQQFYTRADAALADLTSWGQALARPFNLTFQPAVPAAREGGQR